MGNNFRGNQPVIRRLILRSLHITKWILGPFFWIVILAGVADSTISAWLLSKNIDLKGTPLEWIIQNRVLVFLAISCLLLVICLVWVICFFLERDTSWLYTEKEKEHNKLRFLFAMAIEHEIEKISIQEDWKDYQFTELEAEVEAKGRRKAPKIFARFRSSPDRLRREKSLSEALKKSDEPIILVEGEPGSGKSVALRHVALEMVNRIKKAQNSESVLPIYINLKLLVRGHNEKINRDLIESFIKNTLLRSNDRDIRRFLNQELQNGMRDGTLFFLFDSFDEIPEVLNSTEADDKVNEYGNAINDFLHWMNQCHGVIASRFYRGPARLGWTQFRILPLDERRQLELISKTDLASRAKWVVGQLGNANQTIRSLVSNPFFLALLCKYLEGKNIFPENVHVVYQTYIDQRFADDENELQKGFQLGIAQIRSAAEVVAYCMTASPNLGLNPIRTDLQSALIALGFDTSGPLEKLLDALEYMKLARPDTAANTNLSKSFTFSHRRFQEYFATCFVLHESLSEQPRIVTPTQLLTQGSWRETAVVLCQTQEIEKLTPLMEEAEQLLAKFCADIPDLINNPEEYIVENKQETATSQISSLSRFSWPVGLFHLLSLLQDGCASRLTELSPAIRTYIDRLVLSASAGRQRDDKKWALEVAGVASAPLLEYLLEDGFANNSQWLKEVAYKQASRLGTVPPNIARGIRLALLRLANSGRLQQERQTTETHLKRLNQAREFLNGMRLLIFLPTLDFISLLITAFATTIYLYSNNYLLNTYLFRWQFAILWFILLLFVILFLNKGVYSIFISIDLDRFIIIGIIRSLISIITILPWFLALAIFFSVIISLISGNLVKLSEILFIVIIYEFSYSPLAISAVFIGKYTSVYCWPFIPIWPIIYVLQHISYIPKLL